MLRHLVAASRRFVGSGAEKNVRNTLRNLQNMTSFSRTYGSLDDKAPVIDGSVDTNDETFKKNYADMTAVRFLVLNLDFL